ncbi:MAG: hypothetical protein J2P49_06015, partial [Methylocapsa sp.]|nr:hypothetical protein [Methylocapsa sp.]
MRKLDRTFFPPPLAPPRIEKGRVEGIVHGVRLSDDYAWLRAENWREVLRGSGAISGSIRAVI